MGVAGLNSECHQAQLGIHWALFFPKAKKWPKEDVDALASSHSQVRFSLGTGPRSEKVVPESGQWRKG